ncbi:MULTISPECIES: hypothetical protein [unclassified Streptomyces]|uniref:hypothetical protein n=1 Tax=unclassified Streptomyces TaxID=2593676 RepID=UPI002E2C2947|nr:hypothetical protein [Streptomyces sp. NBC_01429]
MNDRNNAPLHALPDGEAELRLVVRLAWEDVAALGQEASRLAAQVKRPVSLDEAASHRLRLRVAGHAKPVQDWPVAAAAPTVSSITGRTPGEHARQAIEKINASDTPQAPAPAPVQTQSAQASSQSSA